MKEYYVKVTETLQRTVKIKANSEEEALCKAEDMYSNEDIILDAEDFVNYDIEVDKSQEVFKIYEEEEMEK